MAGGRKYVVLDFGRLVCLTDIFVPFCADIGVLYIGMSHLTFLTLIFILNNSRH